MYTYRQLLERNIEWWNNPESQKDDSFSELWCYSRQEVLDENVKFNKLDLIRLNRLVITTNSQDGTSTICAILRR